MYQVPKRPFVLALLASLAGHGLILLNPELRWLLPDEPSRPPLVATLRLPPPTTVEEATPPPPPQPPPPPPKPKSPPPPPPVAQTDGLRQVNPEKAKETPPPDPVPVEKTEKVEKPNETAANTPPTPPSEQTAVNSQATAPVDEPPIELDRLPAKGRIRYAVYKGTGGLQIGVATHEWEFTGRNYRINITTETSGIAALVKSIKIEMESRGRVTEQGLAPESLTTKRNGVETAEGATFDRKNGTVHLSKTGEKRNIPNGVQDFATFPYQLAFLPQLGKGTEMPVAVGGKLDTYQFEILGEEPLETPAGVFRTLHVRIPGKTTIDIWLTDDRYEVPAKIRMTDHRGEIFEQIAIELNLGKS